MVVGEVVGVGAVGEREGVDVEGRAGAGGAAGHGADEDRREELGERRAEELLEWVEREHADPYAGDRH